MQKPKGMKLSDEQMADLKRQLNERENRPNYWWLSEEERQKEIQIDKEYEEFDKKHSTVWYDPFGSNGYFQGKKLEGRRVSKKEIIDWLSRMDESARFYVRISYVEKFPPRDRPSPPPDPPFSIIKNNDKEKVEPSCTLINADFRDL